MELLLPLRMAVEGEGEDELLLATRALLLMSVLVPPVVVLLLAEDDCPETLESFLISSP